MKKLGEAIQNSRCLDLPGFSEEFILYTDATDLAIGGYAYSEK